MAGIERNLVPNPSCANDATGWVPTPSGSYARSTSVDAAMPRTTGYEGTGAADINSPRYQVVAGSKYVVSVTIKALVAQHFELVPNWYNASSGGSFISNAGVTSITLAAGQVARYVVGPITAPSGAVSGHLKFNDIVNGGVEISGLRSSPYSGDAVADGIYYDGASAGWTWDGTAGSSTSSKSGFTDAFHATDSFSKSVTADPNSKTPVDAFHVAETFTIAASGTIPDTFTATDGFLVASLSFDPGRGRVRLDAYTFAPSVTHAVVWRRRIGGRYEVIRGGVVPVIAGRFSRIVDDFEYPAGDDCEYLIEGRTDTELVMQRAVVRRAGVGDKSWIKIVANPRFNLRVNVVGWGKISRKARNGRFDVIGKMNPVITSDFFSAREVTIDVLTRTRSETDALDYALSQGVPIFLQMPSGHDLPTLYASVDNYEHDNPKKKDSGHQLFNIPLIEVDAPPPSVVGTVNSYSTVWDDNVTYDDLLLNFDTYDRLAS